MKSNNMKTKTKYFLSILLLGVVLFSCDDSNDDMNHNTSLTEVKYITGDFDAVLEGVSDKFIKLEWEKSVAADMTQVFYIVQFSGDENGFNEPDDILLPGPTDKPGYSSFIEISDSVLNIVAERSGLKQLATENLYWRVVASNGIVQRVANGIRTIKVTRPDGFAAVPSSLYVTGSATSGGDELDKAIQMKNLTFMEIANNELVPRADVFEVVLPLKSGEFKLIDKKTKKHRSFSIVDNKVAEFSPIINCPAEGIYRIKIDFDNANAEFTLVNKVEQVVVKAGSTESVVTALDYAGDCRWESVFTALLPGGAALPNASQYKFRFTETPVLDETPVEQYSYWGATTKSSGAPNATTPASYFYVVESPAEITAITQYYRFPVNVSGKQMKTVLDMNIENVNYTHSCSLTE